MLVSTSWLRVPRLPWNWSDRTSLGWRPLSTSSPL